MVPSRWRLKLTVGALAVAAGVVALVLVFLVDRRTDEEKVRDACRDLVRACLARDFEEVWDLHSSVFHEKAREVFEAVRTDGEYRVGDADYVLTPDPADEPWAGVDDEGLFVRESRESFDAHGARNAEEPDCEPPWILPDAVLRSLTVEEIAFEEGEARVKMGFEKSTFGPTTYEAATFVLVKEGRHWLFLKYELRWTKELPPHPEPPAWEVSATETGKPKLIVTLRLDGEPPNVKDLLAMSAAVPAETTLALRPHEDLAWSAAARVIARAVGAGVRMFEMAPYLRRDRKQWGSSTVESVYSEYMIIDGPWRTLWGTISQTLDGSRDPETVDVVLEVGGAKVPGRGDLRLRVWWARLCKREENPVVLLDFHPGITCGRAANIFDVVEKAGVERILLTMPAETSEPAPTGVLVNGRPFEKVRPDLPPVPKGHDALRRILRAPD